MRTENGEVSLCCKECTDTPSLRFWRVGAERVGRFCPGAATFSPVTTEPAVLHFAGLAGAIGYRVQCPHGQETAKPVSLPAEARLQRGEHSDARDPPLR